MSPEVGPPVTLAPQHVKALEDEEESEDEEERALLDALEQDLVAPPAPTAVAAALVVFGPSEQTVGHGLVHWPVEVKLGIAAFLPWRDLVAFSLLCRAWRDLEREDALWRVPFATMWPRLARRKDAHVQGAAGPVAAGPLWRVLFRARWASKERCEDALEEDWLDYAAAAELSTDTATREGSLSAKEVAAKAALQMELCVALSCCRQKALQNSGVRIPAEASLTHICGTTCKYHRLSIDGDAFVCESSGKVHYCAADEPCADCVVSSDACFLICRVSGRCWPSVDMLENEEAKDEEGAPDCDPELNPTQQFTRWYEQGYNMTEEQADELELCGPEDRKRRRRCYLLAH